MASPNAPITLNGTERIKVGVIGPAGSGFAAADAEATTQAIANLGSGVTGINRLTGDVTAGPGTGSQAATIAANAVTTTKINDGAITAAKIASDAVTTAKILDANVTAAKLASDAVTTGKILDANVTAAKLAATAVIAGSYTAADITVDAQGRLTAAANGALANIAHLDVAQAFTKPQRANQSTLTISTLTFTPDLNVSNHFVLTLAHSAANVMANPSNIASALGQSGMIEIIQSSTGGDAIGTWGSQWVAAGGVSTLTLSSGANAQDFFSYYVIDATHILIAPAAANVSH